ncbi:MAG TPA: TetR family transcriptional regulator [Flavobacteriales bacterium]|nr:TetR family transcriptional regulator [Flavobacteriales bacterium]
MDIKPRQLEIIEAAGLLMTDEGVSALTTKRLAERMQFTEAALYRHFKSKEEILSTMLVLVAALMEDRLSTLDREVEDPVQRMKAMFEGHLRFFAANPHYLMAIFATGLLTRSAGIEQGITALMEVKRRHLVATVKQGQLQGVFKDLFPADVLATIAMGAFRLQMLRWHLSGRTFDLVKKGRPTVHAVVELMRK